MWLMALAVPVQGFAAASMFGCKTGHHGAIVQQSHAGAMHAHHHAGAAGHGDHDKSSATGKHAKASCSACASCCMSAALPATPAVFEATQAPDSFVLSALPVAVSFISDGLERPPRSVLA